MPEYSLILLALFLVSFYLHQHYKVKIFKSNKHLIMTYLVALLVAVAWDQFAIYRGHWSFGEQYLLGPRIGYMPIEEFGFFFTCTYFVFTVYKIMEKRK